MDSFLAAAGVLTPVGLLMFFGLLLYTGHIIPLKTVKYERELQAQALALEREGNKSLRNSIRKLIEQGEMSIEILSKIPTAESIICPRCETSKLTPRTQPLTPRTHVHSEGGENNAETQK